MKPNDKAYAAAIKIYNIHSDYDAESVSLRLAVDAAFAAQFPPSEEYAGLVKELREDVLQFNLKDTVYENIAKDAADALEAVLAERDALNFELAARKEWPQARAEMLEELAKVRAERDALLARLAPADDEALVEIAAKAISKQIPCLEVQWGDIRDAAIDAIAAIRPHIEAAERERCAKTGKAALLKSNYGELHANANYANELGEAIAAAIRSGTSG